MTIDIVTVFHNQKNKQQAEELYDSLLKIESDFTFYAHSNIEDNIGFARACNIGAFREGAEASIIGFLNPDVSVHGPFIESVEKALVGDTVITGNSFNKPKAEIRSWGCKDWVCGASFFVQRAFFEEVRGFDERYVWSWEETDLIRTAQAKNLNVRSIELPITHSSPDVNDQTDSNYKRTNFQKGSKLFYSKWKRGSLR